jgi:hypothetical protein
MYHSAFYNQSISKNMLYIFFIIFKANKQSIIFVYTTQPLTMISENTWTCKWIFAVITLKVVYNKIFQNTGSVNCIQQNNRALAF